jgi:hypothetical protein
MGKLDDGVMNRVDEALAVSFGLGSEESVNGVNG